MKTDNNQKVYLQMQMIHNIDHSLYFKQVLFITYVNGIR